VVAPSVEQISRASHAGVICKALDVINAVLHRHPEDTHTTCSPGGSTSYKESINTSLCNLQDVYKSFKVCTCMCYWYTHLSINC